MPDKKHLKNPGIYLEEIGAASQSVAQVETAIPAFIGYTEQANRNANHDLTGEPWRISSLAEYEQFFGGAPKEGVSITVEIDNQTSGSAAAKATINDAKRSGYLMHYALRLFFLNGGGPCYIVSVGDYREDSAILRADLQKGLETIKKVDEVTLIVFPDSVGLQHASDYYGLHHQALIQCQKLRDRFTVMDVWEDPNNSVTDPVATLRNTGLGNKSDLLQFGAAYYPRLESDFTLDYDPDKVQVIIGGAVPVSLGSLKESDSQHYNLAINALAKIPVILPAAPAVVGVYAKVDQDRGVWKAPANIDVVGVVKPMVKIDDQMQADLNMDPVSGKSINAIRSFTGRGAAVIWGARTLAGNDNEWRYVSVRRFFNMVEESVKKSTLPFVFEPNDANTWASVKGMIENFLQQQWKSGALMGSSPDTAFYVKVGLGETMTQVDIDEGRLIVEIGMAVVRPAEFIILRFAHKMMPA